MKKIILTTILSISSLLAMSNLDVAKKADAVSNGFESSISKTQMILINASGQKRTRDMGMKTLEGEDGDKSISTFLSPMDVKGTKSLVHSHIERDDDQWLYLPALKRVKRIASRNKSGSFMGSEFSYEDIGSQNYKKYDYKDDAKVVSLGGVECYKSIRVPKSKNSGYSKQISWVDTKEFLVQKIDYYDRKKSLLKTAIFSNYTKKQGVWRVGEIVMSNHQNDKKTHLIWVEDKIKVGLTSRNFSKRELKE